MDLAEYDRMDAAEDRLWWYRALHANLADAWARCGAGDGPVLDAGCGTGGWLRRLAPLAPGRTRIGLDRVERAARRAREKADAPVIVGDVGALPFPDACFAAIFSADVLYHRDVEPRRALAEAFRCLVPGGVLLINVPAFDWLSSYHDRHVHGARRFTRGRLRTLLRESGFSPESVRYWNSLLFPLMVARRMRPGGAREGASDVGQLAGWLDASLGAACTVERAIGRLGVRWPAGGSVLAVARK
ncbi:MAG TPA: class I SAM-dependent methyltransferase [Burkholderiaceae bacterium]|nr:class I SAM-dependent methyltransferase [Burkholderiaceae bacterium]